MKRNKCDRKIELESIKNARDLGGLVTEDGHMIRIGTLIRSACLVNANESDFQQLKADYNLNLVIDLRTPKEIKDDPDKRSENIEYLKYPIIYDSFYQQIYKYYPSSDMSNMQKMYRFIAMNKDCRKRLNRIISVIMEHDSGSVLWHCSEGKDRCGIVTAIVLIMLGVSKEEIMRDYLITNDINKPKAESVYRNIIEEGMNPKYAEEIKMGILAESSYLDAALDAMVEKCGSLYAYVTDWIGISENAIEEFRRKILI